MENKYFDADELNWEDPKPLKKDAGDRWNRVKQALIDHPNQWAIIAYTDNGKINTTILKKKHLGDGFDITCRHSGKERTVYARYVGKLNEED